MRHNMFRYLITTVLFTTTNAFGDGTECGSVLMTGLMGNCIKISDCTTNEWTFGSADSPVCDEPGASWKLPDTKVCCFDSPKKGQHHKGATAPILANAHDKPAHRAKKAQELKHAKKVPLK